VGLSRRAATLRRVRLGEVISVIVLVKRAVKGLLKDGFGLIDLELALQISHMVGDAAAVGAATSVGEAERLVCDLVINRAPISPAKAVLLDLLGVGVDVAVLCKEAWKVLRRVSGAFSKTLVITVVGLNGTSHV
jgi:hypothetical protein